MRTQGGKITVLAEKNVDVDGHGRSAWGKADKGEGGEGVCAEAGSSPGVR